MSKVAAIVYTMFDSLISGLAASAVTFYTDWNKYVERECPECGSDLEMVRHNRSSGRYFLECPNACF